MAIQRKETRNLNKRFQPPGVLVFADRERCRHQETESFKKLSFMKFRALQDSTLYTGKTSFLNAIWFGWCFLYLILIDASMAQIRFELSNYCNCEKLGSNLLDFVTSLRNFPTIIAKSSMLLHVFSQRTLTVLTVFGIPIIVSVGRQEE